MSDDVENELDGLSQDEIDALLNGIEEEKLEVNDDELDIKIYDFAAQERIVSGRMSGLYAINERFIRNFRTSLMNLLRRSVEVSVIEIVTVKSNEYFSELIIPANINLLRMKPLHGTGVCIIDNDLLFTLVDSLFGGEGKLPKIKLEKSEFTQMEMSISTMLLKMIIQDFENAWHAIFPVKIDIQGFEMNPQLINISSANEMIIVKRFKISLDGESVGNINVGLPYSMIEPIRTTLEAGSQSDTEEINELWATSLKEEVFDAKLILSGSLGETSISFRKMLELNAGDVLPIEMYHHITLLAGGLPTFRAKFGISNGHCAIKIIGRVDRS